MSADDLDPRLVEQRLARLSVLTELTAGAGALADPRASVDDLLLRVAERLGCFAVLLLRGGAPPALLGAAGISRASRALRIAPFVGPSELSLPYPELSRDGLVRWDFSLGEVGHDGPSYLLFFTPADSGSEMHRAIADRVSLHLRRALEHRQLVVDLQRSYRELEETQRALLVKERLAAVGELAAAVAHEVRNPLAAMFNGLSALEKRLPEGEDERVLMNILTEEARRLSRIVDDLLSFARPRQHAPQPTPLPPLLRSVAELARASQEPPADKRVDLRIEGELPELEVDAHQLRQALLNLVLNALQATAPGGEVVLSASSPGGPGAGVDIEVRDRGAGIPAEVQPRIFEPFFTTRASGTGLGLAIVRRVVDAHGGALSFHSGRHGTTFRVALPAR